MTRDEAIADAAREAMSMLAEVGREPVEQAPARLVVQISDLLTHVTNHLSGEVESPEAVPDSDPIDPEECLRHTARMLAAATLILYSLMPGIPEEPAQVSTH